MVKPSACILLVLLAASPAYGSDIIGTGGAKCADMANDYKKWPDKTKIFYVSWVEGYISGNDAARTDAREPTFDIPDDVGVNILWDALTEYCDEHPLKPVFAAADNYIATLKSIPQAGHDNH